MIIRKPEDYYDKVQEKFPDLTRWEIDKILKHGMRTFYLYNWSGGDVLLKSNYFTLYSGKMFSSNLAFYHYWRIKYKIKFRILYKHNREKYSGKYYVGLTDNEYEEYLNQFSSTGRRRQKVTFKNMYAYKIKEECFLDKNKKHFFEMDYPEDLGFVFYKAEYITRNIRYIAKRNGNNELETI